MNYWLSYHVSTQSKFVPDESDGVFLDLLQLEYKVLLMMPVRAVSLVCIALHSVALYSIVLSCFTFIHCAAFWFLPERDYVTFGSLPPYIRLSSVTLVRPTQVVEAFGIISSPLCTVVILWPPYKILRRLSQRNPSIGSVKRKRVAKYSDFGPIEGYIS